MGTRATRVPGAAVAALSAVLLIAASMLAACGGTAATPGGSSAPPASPTAAATTPSPAGSAVPSAGDYGAAAIAIIQALGGQVPAGSTPFLTVTEADGSGSVHVALDEWQLAWDAKGVLRYVFWGRYAYAVTPPPGDVLSEERIIERVAALVQALDLDLGPPQELVPQEEAWMAAWPRLVDGIRAEENGTRLWLFKDGSFLQYSYTWSPLGTKPANPITAAQAMQAVDGCNGREGPPESCQAELVWHMPSTGGPDEPLVLCWSIGLKGGGDWQAWVDAGTGKVVDVAAMLD